jgi:hypothetical protein
MAKANSDEKIRFNLDLLPETAEQVEILKQLGNAYSSAEVFRRALAVYMMTAQHIKEGGMIVFVDSSGDRMRVALPEFAHLPTANRAAVA